MSRSQAPESGAGVRRRSRSQESDDSLTAVQSDQFLVLVVWIGKEV